MIGNIAPETKYRATINDVCIGVETSCAFPYCGVEVIPAVRTDLIATSGGGFYFYSNDPESPLFQRGGGDIGVPRENLSLFTGTQAEWDAEFCNSTYALNFCTP